MAHAAPLPEDLLQQLAQVRRLAADLVRDRSVAEDVAQEAMLVALQRGADHPGQGVGSGAWLAGVVRNLVRNHHRSEVRRRGRDTRFVQDRDADQPQGSVDEAVERGEQRAVLTRAVMDLREPYRTVVLLRYFEQHSPDRIAHSLGRPLETVRTQLQRGLRQLREDLDRRHDGDRRAWATALLPLAWPHLGAGLPASVGVGVASGVGGLSWSGILLPLLGTLAAALVFLVSQVSPRPEIAGGDLLSALSLPVDPAPTLGAEGDGDALRRGRTVDVPRSAAVPAAADGVAYQVRVLGPDGEPLSGARVEPVEARHGSYTTDGQGLAGFSADGPVRVRVKARGFLEAVAQLDPLVCTTLDVLLQPARTHHLRVVSTDSGAPIANAEIRMRRIQDPDPAGPEALGVAMSLAAHQGLSSMVIGLPAAGMAGAVLPTGFGQRPSAESAGSGAVLAQRDALGMESSPLVTGEALPITVVEGSQSLAGDLLQVDTLGSVSRAGLDLFPFESCMDLHDGLDPEVLRTDASGRVEIPWEGDEPLMIEVGHPEHLTQVRVLEPGRWDDGHGELALEPAATLHLVRDEGAPQGDLHVVLQNPVVGVLRSVVLEAGATSRLVQGLEAGKYQVQVCAADGRPSDPLRGGGACITCAHEVRLEPRTVTTLELFEGRGTELLVHLPGLPAEGGPWTLCSARDEPLASPFPTLAPVVEGTARLRWLDPGTHDLTLDGRGGSCHLGSVEVQPAGSTPQEVTLSLGAGSLEVRQELLHGELPGVVLVRGPQGSEHPVEWTSFTFSGSNVIEGLAPGTYEVWAVRGQQAWSSCVEVGVGRARAVLDLRHPPGATLEVECEDALGLGPPVQVTTERGIRLPFDLFHGIEFPEAAPGEVQAISMSVTEDPGVQRFELPPGRYHLVTGLRSGSTWARTIDVGGTVRVRVEDSTPRYEVQLHVQVEGRPAVGELNVLSVDRSAVPVRFEQVTLPSSTGEVRLELPEGAYVVRDAGGREARFEVGSGPRSLPLRLE